VSHKPPPRLTLLLRGLPALPRALPAALLSLSLAALGAVGCSKDVGRPDLPDDLEDGGAGAGGHGGAPGRGGAGGSQSGRGGSGGGQGGSGAAGAGGSAGQGGAGGQPGSGGTGGRGSSDAGAGGAGGSPGDAGALDPAKDLTYAYDPFDDAPGKLSGPSAGVGWGGAWSMQDPNGTEEVIADGGLTYPGLAVSGNRGTGSGYSSAGRPLATMEKGPFDEVAVTADGNRYVGAAGKTVWMSFLVRKDSDSDANVGLQLTRGNVVWAGEDKAPVRVGFFGTASKKGDKRVWALGVVNDAGSAGAPLVLTDKEVAIGKVALVVLKLEFGAPHKVSLYVDPPALMGPEPATPDATTTTMGPLPFRNLVYTPGKGTTATHASIDEIRFGRSFASVTPRAGVAAVFPKPPQVTIPADSALVVNRVRILARPRYTGRLIRATIKGSNTGETTNFEEIGSLSYPPAEGAFTEYVFPANKKAYRYVKLVSAPGGHVTAAEVEFYGGNTRLKGRAFGSAGALNDAGNTFPKALDGDAATFFEAPTPSDAYVGFDLGTAETQVATPTFSPMPGTIAADSVAIAIATTTPGAMVKCTTDGSWPAPDHGTSCGGTTTFTKAQTPGGRGKLALKAIAYKNGLFDSVVATGNYYLNYTGTDVTTFHLGNSLTDTLNGHFGPISAAAGKDHTYWRCTVPGAPTEYHWELKDNGCLGVGSWPQVYENPGRFGVLDHQSTQPFSGHGRSVENEAGYALKFLDAARTGGATGIQQWLYGQWPDRTFDDNFSRGRATLAGGDVYPYPNAATTYEKAALNHMAYFASLKRAVDAQIAANPAKYGTKPVLVIPGPLAMYALLKTIYAGDVTTFLAENYEDGVHLHKRAAYYIGLLAYAAIFGESPENKENSHYVTVGIPVERARALQKLAWDTWRAYAADPAYWPNAKP
jgi:hypothetical protein